MPAQERTLRRGTLDRKLLVEAALWLTLIDLALRTLPFRRLAPYLGARMQESPLTADDAQRSCAEGVARAIRSARPRLPFEPACLTRAIAAMAMLRRRAQGSTLYLGLANGKHKELRAHAWLRSGDVVVTGGGQRDGYIVVGRFMKSGAEGHI